ncbi:hypothetical protein NMY22_g14319 [Coprinellus aureogranulatus]|nr:hypothetical protein NMY22_g14319 [Coprinellus aureogranulatus]
MANIVDLPTELLLAVVHSLGPHDILRLQSSSRSLHARLNEGFVWRTVLRNMCKAQSIFYPSYPVKENSYYTRLEPPVKPVTSTAIDIGQPVYSECHFLVPGGRFLIVAFPSTLRLFDLGPPDRTPFPKPVLVEDVKIEEHIAEDSEQHAAMTVQMLSESSLSEPRKRNQGNDAVRKSLPPAYDIEFGSAGPAFNHVATLKFEKSAFEWAEPYFLLTSSKDVTLIVLIDDFLCVNIVWNVPGMWYGFGPRVAILNGTTVVEHCGSVDFAIWSCSSETLHTFPVDRTTGVQLPFDIDSLYDADTIPLLRWDSFPDLSARRVLGLGASISSVWVDTRDEGVVLCEILFEGNAGNDPPPEKGTRLVLGCPLRITPVLKGEAYQTSPLVFEVQQRFWLPPNLGQRGCRAHRPPWRSSTGVA